MRIEQRICRNNLGESDDAHAAAYVAALTTELQSEFPHADVIVNLKSNFANACQTIVTGAPDTGPDDDYQAIRERVGQIANRVWEAI